MSITNKKNNENRMKHLKTIPEEELKCIKKILVIQYKPFGDILLNTGYLPFLRAKFPDAQIDFLIQRRFLTVLEDNPNLDNLIIMEKKKGLKNVLERYRIIRKIYKEKYDVIIDQICGTGSAQVTLFSGAKYKIGWHLKRRNRFYNYTRYRKNDKYYSLLKFHLLEPLGIYEQDHELEYIINENSQIKIDSWLDEMNLKGKQFIVFSPGTPVFRRKWDLESFARLGDLIYTNLKLKVVLMWGPGEKVDCIKIVEKMNTKPILALPTSFNEAAALVKRAKVYISQDGGINHVAVAVKTPSIALFGPHSNPKKWQAWHKPEHPYIRNWECTDQDDRTLGISPDMVYEKLEEILKII